MNASDSPRSRESSFIWPYHSSWDRLGRGAGLSSVRRGYLAPLPPIAARVSRTPPPNHVPLAPARPTIEAAEQERRGAVNATSSDKPERSDHDGSGQAPDGQAARPMCTAADGRFSKARGWDAVAQHDPPHPRPSSYDPSSVSDSSSPHVKAIIPPPSDRHKPPTVWHKLVTMALGPRWSLPSMCIRQLGEDRFSERDRLSLPRL